MVDDVPDTHVTTSETSDNRKEETNRNASRNEADDRMVQERVEDSDEINTSQDSNQSRSNGSTISDDQNRNSEVSSFTIAYQLPEKSLDMSHSSKNTEMSSSTVVQCGSLKSSGAKPSVGSTIMISSSMVSSLNENYSVLSKSEYSSSTATIGKSMTFVNSTASQSSVTTTHRMKSRMNRRRRRKIFGHESDEDEDSDDDENYADYNDTVTSQSDTTSISRAAGSRHSGGMYDSVGAVAVYSTGILVSQTPAVLTHPTEEYLQRQALEDEESCTHHDSLNIPIDAESFVISEPQRTLHVDIASSENIRLQHVPFGDAVSPPHRQQPDETIRTTDRTPKSIMAESSFGGHSCAESSFASQNNANDEISQAKSNFDYGEKNDTVVRLPCYWSPVVWGGVGAMIVLLAIVLSVVLISNEKKQASLPTMTPTTFGSNPTPSFDPMKTRVFDLYMNVTYDDWKEDRSSPQYKAYRWLLHVDEITPFSENMDSQSIEIMKTRFGLAALYFSLGGDDWFLSNEWLNPRLDQCKWQFVDCRAIENDNNVAPAPTLFRDVTGLRIPQNNLRGALPNELMYLSNLSFILLPGNSINGIEAFHNERVGSRLRWVDLSNNPIQTHESIFHLTNLEGLLFSNTQFSGSLPNEISRLSRIRSLDLAYNQLSGSLNSHFTTMDRLESIVLDMNKFEGRLDDVVNCGNCSKTLITFSSLGRNPWTGSLPESLSRFSKLQRFSISQSKLTGGIPSEIGKMTDLTRLDLTENYYFSTSIGLPSEIGDLVDLKILSLSGSLLGGTIPSEISKILPLEILAIDRTVMTGSIAAGACHLEYLSEIRHSSGVNCSCPEKNICTLVGGA